MQWNSGHPRRSARARSLEALPPAAGRRSHTQWGGGSLAGWHSDSRQGGRPPLAGLGRFFCSRETSFSLGSRKAVSPLAGKAIYPLAVWGEGGGMESSLHRQSVNSLAAKVHRRHRRTLILDRKLQGGEAPLGRRQRSGGGSRIERRVVEVVIGLYYSE